MCYPPSSLRLSWNLTDSREDASCTVHSARGSLAQGKFTGKASLSALLCRENEILDSNPKIAAQLRMRLQARWNSICSW